MKEDSKVEGSTPSGQSDDGKSSIEDVSEIAKLFEQRSVFITGAAGFLGTVLLATLLQYCPGIANVYVLLRPKKGVSPTDRLQNIFEKKIFSHLTEFSPEVLSKVQVVPGDVSEENLGISGPMLIKMEDEVSFVFHCAAVLNFKKPLGYMIKQNVIGTENVVKLCRRMKNLKVLVHTSTAYSFSNRFDIDENVPMLQAPPTAFMEAARSGDEEALLKLSKECLPPWPNTYTFSKAVAENYLCQEVKDIPVTIVRPSIIFCTWKSWLPGYIEAGFGITDIGIGVGKGFIRVVNVDPDRIVDIIPVDVVVNTLLTTAWYVHKKKPENILVVNCVSSNVIKTTWKKCVYSLYRMKDEYPFPNMYQKPSITIIKNEIWYRINSVFDHYAPAAVIDFALLIMGKKPILTKHYIFFDTCLDKLRYFTMNEWHYKCDNYNMLISSQTQKDKEVFPIDLQGMSFVECTYHLIKGAPFYDWSIDKRGYKQRMAIAQKRYIVTVTIKWLTVTLFLYLFAIVIHKMHSLMF